MSCINSLNLKAIECVVCVCVCACVRAYVCVCVCVCVKFGVLKVASQLSQIKKKKSVT